jgi:hypothetical protein
VAVSLVLLLVIALGKVIGVRRSAFGVRRSAFGVSEDEGE